MKKTMKINKVNMGKKENEREKKMTEVKQIY